MKKLVSIVLVTVILMSAMSVSTFAENNDVLNTFLYQDKFEEFIKLPERTDSLVEDMETYYYDYDELYYHKNADTGEVDWVLARAYTNVPPPPWMMVYVKQIGNRVIKSISPGIVKLPYSFVIYSSTDDCFYDIYGINPDDYEGLGDTFEELELGHAVGDVDVDGSVSIMDATTIQLYLAKEEEIEYIYTEYFTTLADVDKTGDMSVMDATVIQRNLAKVDEQPVVNEEMVFSDSSQRLSSMPEYADALFFDYEYGRQQIVDSIYKLDKFDLSRNTIVIVKSNEQYRELFNEDAPKFEDDFFKNRCLIAALVRTPGMKGSAYVDCVAKAGDTLYVRSKIYRPSGLLEPIEPYWLSIVSVRKELVSDVYNVVEVYSY